MPQLSRREFLRVSSFVGAATVVASCGPQTAAPAEPTAAPVEAPPPTAVPPSVPPPEAPSRYSEAPMLAELVQQGELPPVEERLPANPRVVPVETIGKYGGTIRRGFKGVSDSAMLGYFNRRVFAQYNQESIPIPDVAESWEVDETGKEWTYHLRKGMRWSDGEPYTSQAVRYWYDSVLMNGDITLGIQASYKTGAGDDETVMEVETPDDLTVVFRYAHPKPLAAHIYAGYWGQVFQPGHYLFQFHDELTDNKAALQKAVTDGGYTGWPALYDYMRQDHLNPECPVVSPWVATNPLSSELFQMARNPYFFWVDQEGNQLPYIDHLSFRLFEAYDVFLLWVLNGEIDWQARHVDLANFTLLQENKDKGDYWIPIGVGTGHIGLNNNHASKNARVSEFFQSRDVRIAISHAVNREEMNELVYDGLMKPRQYSPLEESPQYCPALSNAYLEYDPDKANDLLDAAGYTERGEDGYRLFKDGSGETLSFIIEGFIGQGIAEDTAELTVKYLGDVGVKAVFRTFERALFTEHWQANEVECGFWGGDRTLLPMVTPDIFLGLMPDRPWAGAWGLWKANPNDPNGAPPPDGHWIWDIWNTWAECEVEPDDVKREAVFREILDIWLEELPMICFLGQTPTIAVVKNGMGNQPEKCVYRDEYTATYFWEEPEKH